jgi:hypothetical protein
MPGITWYRTVGALFSREGLTSAVMSHNPIKGIVKRFGSQTEMARMLGCRQATIWHWCNRGVVPSERIPEIIAIGRTMDPPIHLEPNDFFSIGLGDQAP